MKRSQTLSSSRMCLRSADEASTKSFVGSMRAGTMQNGTVSPRPPSAPLTAETDSSYLPTPAAQSYGTNQGGAAGRVGKVRASLETLARQGKLPRPTANAAETSTSIGGP